MNKQRKQNKGFSFIELLIAVAIFSIIMIMVVQFMSTTSGAYKKTKKNLNIQTEAIQVTEQMSDIIMQASYIRVAAADGAVYNISYNTEKERNITTEITYTENFTTFDLVPDNYGNYVETGDPFNLDMNVNIDFDTYKLVNAKGKTHPDDTDDRDIGSGDVKSYRILNRTTGDYYIQPKYIYIEYRDKTDDFDATNPSENMQHVLYEIENHKKIYMVKYEAAISDKTKGYDYAKTQLTTARKAAKEGLLTENISDFYLCPHVKGNAFTVDIMFEDDNYKYNAVETIKFRNSNVLTVKPQKLFKVK